MITIGPATRVLLILGATDMRKGRDGWLGLVSGYIEEDPLSGHLFVFCNRTQDRIRVLFWDESGYWLCGKQLERGRYSWPQRDFEGKRLTLSAAAWAMLVGGIDLARGRRKRWWRKNEIPEKNHQV